MNWKIVLICVLVLSVAFLREGFYAPASGHIDVWRLLSGSIVAGVYTIAMALAIFGDDAETGCCGSGCGCGGGRAP
jgi:hypothetical protein